MQELGDHFRRILKIGHDSDDGVAGRLVHGMKRRADVAEVPGIDNHPDIGVGGRNPLQDFNGAVARVVVDKNMLVAVPPHLGHHLSDAGIQLLDIFFLVETPRYDADSLHADPTGAAVPFRTVR